MLTVNNKIIKWKNINWNKIIGYRRIIFPNNMEAEVFSIDRQLPPGTIYYTLKFIYNFVDRNLQKDFLIGCYEAFELMQKKKRIITDIELNFSYTSEISFKGRRFIYYNVEIRFGVQKI